MNVRDWVVQHTAAAPSALVEAMLIALGDEESAPVVRAGDVCIAAAARELGRLIATQRFGRDAALDLLAIDALTTLAYEYAAEHSAGVDDIASAASRGIKTLSAASLARV